ncbi:MAG: carboxypeptidase-like regulatory domain-containing protein [Kofleriaceae bacterium]
MTGNRKALLAVVALAVVGLAVWLLFLRGGDAPRTAAPTASGSGTPAEQITKPARVDTERPASSSAPPPSVLIDRDPEGPLRLEGQVLDGDDAPVGDAEVVLSSNPPRTARTEADGSFAFDKLVARVYRVSARAGELTGGPVPGTPSGEPVVIRLRQGAVVVVHVADEAGAAVAGHQVELRATVDQVATTNDAGVATFRGVGAGWSVVTAAPQGGFAAASTTAVVGAGGASIDVTLVLRRGAAISGRVLDEAGKPIAGARVLPRDASAGWDFADGSRDGVLTDAKGAYAIAAVAPGTYRLTARAPGFAPGSSGLVTVDGRTALTDQDIRLSPGGTIAGKVVDGRGAPAPYATVRIGGAPGDRGVGEVRQVSTDDAGGFRVDGLPRAKLRAHAESETAASAIVDVDLVAAAEANGVVLALDVTGTIAGTVVDSAGQPVAEVTVTATPDIWKGTGLDRVMLAGPATATTDGGGAFVLRGLPDADFRVSASGGGATGFGWGAAGAAAVSAHTGATGVRVLLPTPGSIVGTLVIDGEREAPSAVAQVGWSPPTPVVAGKIRIAELAPGEHDVTLRGPMFGDYTVRAVKVEPGKETDLGTVTVPRGRRLTGKVVDASGAPVVGAKVVIGDMLFADGKQLGMGDETIESQSGLRSTRSGEGGAFTIIGLPREATGVMADHEERGRSPGAMVPAGDGDPPAITLTLRAFGSIAGKVIRAGQPGAGYQVLASVKDSEASQLAVVTTGDDGAFVLEKVPSGSIYVQAIQPGMMSMTNVGTTVEVAPGKRAEVTLEFAVGDVTLTVSVAGLAGAHIDGAQVFLVRGIAAFANGQDITDATLKGGSEVVGMKFSFGGAPAVFPELVPGKYSVCTLPITGDMNDPVFAQRLQENAMKLAVYCKQVEVTPSPKAQELVHEVPAMNPLPPPAP